MRVPDGYRALVDGEVIRDDDVFYSKRDGELMRAQDLPSGSSAGSKWFGDMGRVPYYRIAKTPKGNICVDSL